MKRDRVRSAENHISISCGSRGTPFEIEAKTNRESAAIVIFTALTAITGKITCTADVEGKTVTNTLTPGQTWAPGDGEVRELSRDEVFSKPVSDFVCDTMVIVCPNMPSPPKVAEVWHVLCAPAH